jgi:hypothetical protein
MTRPSTLSRALWPDGFAACLVTLLPLAYFLPATRGRLFLAPDDGVIFNVPLRVAAARILEGGALPLWNPYLFAGMPLHASAQGGLLFPLNWFYYVAGAQTATNLMALSTYMLAALGAYLFARRTGSGPAGSIMTSVVYQMCGFMVAQLGHINIVQTAALVPWLLWAVERYGSSGRRADGLVAAAVVMLQAFTGHQQTLAYSLLLAGAYALVMWRAGRGREGRFYLWSLALLGAGVLLAAVQILPTYELMRNSLRSQSSYDFFTSFSLPPRFLLTFFAPYVVGGGDGRLFRAPYAGPPFYGEFIAYAGLGALGLAAVAFIWKRDARTKFWAAVVVVGLALALGRHWPLKLYAVVYYLPGLNLFRVPARHVLEVDFALAALAGRGLTALASALDRERARRLALAVGAAVFVITCLVVTVGRPADFRLAREAPATLLRAPELFVPIVVAGLTAWALWAFARKPSAGATLLLVAVVAFDLALWGQFSGWRQSSPKRADALWRKPPALALLRRDGEPFRVLTVPHAFDPAQKEKVVGPLTTRSTDWVFWLQPDVYMMHGVENASGYDGFGLARYSRLAGDMTVWGELPDPEQTLRGRGRELDILNVRYLLAMSRRTATAAPVASSPAPALPATTTLGGQLFADADLGAAGLKSGARLHFDVPEVAADRVSLLTNLSWATEVEDGRKVAAVRVLAADGRVFELELLAGRHTAEWAHERADIRPVIKHQLAPAGTSYEVADAQGRYQGHAYVAALALPERVNVRALEVETETVAGAPELTLSLLRATLADGPQGVALPREWVRKTESRLTGRREVEVRDAGAEPPPEDARWRRVGEADGVVVYENLRALPRAWLATEAVVLDEAAALAAIRAGRLPSGQEWEPRRTALVEENLSLSPRAGAGGGSVEFVRRGAGGVELRTKSDAPALLVLGENYYPGWRAEVDGRAAETLRVNYNLRGVELPAGEHTVRFTYRPRSLMLGLLVSLLTLVGLVLWAVNLPRRRGGRGGGAEG